MVVEDRTQEGTLENLKEKVDELAITTGKSLVALSDNDQKIIAQVKEALEEITKTVLFLDKKLNLLTDIFESCFVSEDPKESKQLSLHEYKDLVTKFR